MQVKGLCQLLSFLRGLHGSLKRQGLVRSSTASVLHVIGSGVI